ncbi:MAG: hypothetical protein NVSMB67_10920 [Flavisolibacter sp.]
MRKIFLFIIITLVYNQVNAQGCVAIRGNGGTCTMTGVHHDAKEMDSWMISLNYRYFKSYKHFVGTAEQKQRVALGTEVINHVNAFDLDLIKAINKRWSLGLFLPITANTRSSLYEHDGKNRRQTSSFGLGDMRVAAYYWMIDPIKQSRFNIQTGLGIKFPTGDYKYQDYFYKSDTTKILGPVDQSIQLGDGGTGLTLEANAFYSLSKKLVLFGNLYYLSNPRNQNGVSTARGSAPSATSILYGSDVMSVPDQYMIRAGADLKINQFIFSAGMRMECVPVHDLIGGSDGFRRPGYVLSSEPVVAYKARKMQFYLSIPFAVQRNRTQSVADKIKTAKTGIYAQGDAAFADYTVNCGLSYSIK